jgi:hypothetical protein
VFGLRQLHESTRRAENCQPDDRCAPVRQPGMLKNGPRFECQWHVTDCQAGDIFEKMPFPDGH